MRKNETSKDYNTIQGQIIRYQINEDLEKLTIFLNDHLDEISRHDAIEIAVMLNNLMLKLEK